MHTITKIWYIIIIIIIIDRYDNNIAILELDERVEFSRSVSAVCPPRAPAKPGDMCRVTSHSWKQSAGQSYK